METETNNGILTDTEDFEEYSAEAGGRKEKKLFARFERASERLHKNHRSVNRTMNLGFVLMLAAVVICAFAMRQFIFEPTLVDGESMITTLADGERVAVIKFGYWFTQPKRGDIVIVHYPNRTERFVKRVIAFAGETISIDDGYICINGERLDESEYAGSWYGNIYKQIVTKGSFQGYYTVPEGCVFVMGDNRNNSHDSRDKDVGAIPNEQVLGRVVAVIWPFNSFRSVK